MGCTANAGPYAARWLRVWVEWIEIGEVEFNMFSLLLLEGREKRRRHEVVNATPSYRFPRIA